MRKNKFGINLLTPSRKRLDLIILLSIISMIFQLVRYDFEFINSLNGFFVTFLFATFITYLYSIFLNLYKPTSFYSWWWKIYGVMIFLGVFGWIIFGDWN